MRAALFLALAGLISLSACDSNSESDSMDGVWETTASYRVDSLMPATNYRIKADYDVTFKFDLQQEDGLLWGTVTAEFNGYLISREAGRNADTLLFNGDPVLVDQVFGTLSGADAELDVPWGPYEENLWTFNKVAGRLDLEGKVINKWSFNRQNVAGGQETFEFLLPNLESPLIVHRTDRATSASSVRPDEAPYSPRDLLTHDGPSRTTVLRSIAAQSEQ